jgi:hypothetical protein
MKYNINLIRGCMRLTTIVVATVAIASSSFGAIGETPPQFEPRKADEVIHAEKGFVFMIWNGKTVIHSGGFYNSRAFMESFQYRDNHKMNNADINKFLKPYLAAGLRTGPVTSIGKVDYLSLLDRDGSIPAMIGYNLENNILSVTTFDAWVQIYPEESAQRAAMLKQNKAKATSATAAPADKKNDCLIVATEAFARLKQSSAWTRIAGFTFLNDGVDAGGHAVVFFQPTASSNVFMYDKTLGSIDLGTQSHELLDIIDALNAKMKAADLFQAGDPNWLAEAGGLANNDTPTIDDADSTINPDTAKQLIDAAIDRANSWQSRVSN